MRILALDSTEKGILTVFIAFGIIYDEEYKGIGFYSYSGDYYYIPNVSLNDYNSICRSLTLNGYCDVTRYGEIFIEEDE